MARETDTGVSYTIHVQAVREAIIRLQSRPIHPFFPAYLHLRQQSVLQKTTTEIRPNWNSLGEFLEIPGGPVGKPYFRPFWVGRRDAGQEWLNRNLAGSYAPSSIRSTPRKVIEINGDGTFRLRDKHWELALTHLAGNQRVPVVALAGFFSRNFEFIATTTPGPAALVEEFFRTFEYDLRSNMVEMNHLFSDEWIGSVGLEWFAPISKFS